MYITLETDYAIRIVRYLITEGKRVDAQKISNKTDVTLRFSLKILRKLVLANIVKSYKGINGGYEFAKQDPSELSLYDVIKAVEGDCILSRCLDENIGCNRNREKVCKVRKAFDRISNNLKKQLEEVTFDTLV